MELDGLPSTIMPLPAVTLTFDLLAQSEHVCPGPGIAILVKLAQIFTNILY